ncbi:TonB-dependent siderophore receptor [Halopseudomonas pachastrellae]|uniref:TonB-dependent siderophore receptor n=1 Tax=Halopseudomonas pachastrellae TaxID=254161 RepID=UPI003D7CC0EC
MKRPPFARRRLAALTGALLLGSTVMLASGATHADTTTARHYEVAAGSLENALNQFGRQAGILLSYDPALVRDHQAGQLRGEYGVLEGLQQLLRGTGLQAIPQADGSYSLAPLQTAEGVTALPAMLVSTQGASATTEGSDSYTTESMASSTGLELAIRDTPQSVTVVTRERMEDQNLTSISKVMEQIVGIEANSTSSLGSDGVTYMARGFSVENYLVDGVPRPPGIYGFTEETADMIAYDRIEVVRGASGLMSGMGSPSASVNLIRKRATDTPQAHINLQAGSWDLYRGEVDVSGPLIDSGRLRGRLATAWQESDSFIDREHSEQQAAYGILEADLTESTTLSAGFEYQDFTNEGASRGGIPLFYTDGSHTHLSRSTNSGTDWSDFSRDSLNIFATLDQQLNDRWKLQLHAEHKTGGYDESLGYVYARALDRQTGAGGNLYMTRWAADLALTAFNASLQGSFDWLGQEHQLSFSAFHADYTEKGDNYHGWYTAALADSIAFYQNGNWPKPDLGAIGGTFGTDVKTTAFTAAARLNPTDRLHLLVGARVSDWQQDDWTKTAAGAKTTTPITNENGVVTPYAGLVFDLTEQWSTYASYTAIFEPQNEQDISGKTLDPLEGNNYELGLKGELMDGRLNATLSVFQLQQENLAVSLGPGFVTPNGAQAYRAEAGAESEGFELELAGELAEGWQVAGGFARTTTENSTGDHINRYIPDNTFKLFTTYEWDQLLHGLTVGGNLRWQDEAVAEDAGPNGEDFVQDSLFLVDLLAKYRVNEQLSVALNLKNAFDKTYYSGMQYIGRYGEPRNLVASARWQF